MQIKSDETPKQNRFSEFLKKHKSSEISGLVVKVLLMFTLAAVIFYMGNLIFTSQKEELRIHEEQQIADIVKYKPVIKYYTKYFLPDEYELMQTDGRNTLFVTPKGLDEDTVYLSNCSLMLSKKVTDSFREAVYKKRGYITARAKEEQRLQYEATQAEIQKELPPKPNKQEPKKSIVLPTITVYGSANDSNNTSIHGYDYYQRKAYADGYNPLVLSHIELETYKLTTEYKSLKKFERTKELEELNRAYNEKRSKMWTLHYKFGLAHGSYAQLEEGKLKVKMIKGSLEFGYNF